LNGLDAKVNLPMPSKSYLKLNTWFSGFY